jgi:GNAT superfamily N-acetyltransferase
MDSRQALQYNRSKCGKEPGHPEIPGKQERSMTTIQCKELTPAKWDDLETLFGSKGACGGCWCMYWRVERGEKWNAIKGQINRQAFKNLVTGRKAHGAIAYAGNEPVGWCSFDKRQDYYKLDRAPSLKCEDAADVWSIPCFYIKNSYRRQGVAKALLSFAVETLKTRYKAKIIEGYPVQSKRDAKIPAAFAWTGTSSLFLKAEFKPVGRPGGGKRRMRLCL